MKKLLLSLGAVASVAAPVAAVVACGSTNDSSFPGSDLKGETVLSAELDTQLAKFGYTVTQPQADEIYAQLRDNAKPGTVTLKFGKIAQGQTKGFTEKNGGVRDNLHDADDFLILVEGGEQKDLPTPTPTELDFTSATSIKTHKDASNPTDNAAKNTFKDHYGTFTVADFEKATSAIYLHHTSTITTLDIKEVIVKDGKVYEITPTAVSAGTIKLSTLPYTAPTK